MSKAASPRRKSSATDEWDKQWQEHWSKVGTPGYELPVGGPGGEEREFLAAARTPVVLCGNTRGIDRAAMTGERP